MISNPEQTIGWKAVDAAITLATSRSDERVTMGTEVALDVAVGYLASAPLRGGAALTELGVSSTAAKTTTTAAVKEGIYEGADALAPGKTYVGQSGNVPARLAQQQATGRFPKSAQVKVQEIKGDKAAREVAEQKRINELEVVGSNPGSQTSNIRNPIGRARKHLMKEPEKE